MNILEQRRRIYLRILLLYSVLASCAAQNFWKITDHSTDDRDEDRRIKIVWCTVSRPEQNKCLSFSRANDRDRIRVGYDYFRVDCVQGSSKDDCMKLLDQEKAVLTTVDAGEVFIGGRYNSLVPIAQEVLHDPLTGPSRHYYAVAAVRKGTLSDVSSLYDLRGKKACFAGVETFAGWVLPIYTLMREGGMSIIDCNNHVKSASHFFGQSCAVNILTEKYNPVGDNSDKLCQLCIGRIPGGRCTSSDPYAGYDGAFRCLLESGEIAFLRHSTIPELLTGNEYAGISKDSFELLCKDGLRRPLEDYLNCNWGKVPSNAVVTTSASSFELRKKYQLFLKHAVERYGKKNLPLGPSANPLDTNNQFNNRPAEFDQFGNALNRNVRTKRQNFGDFGGSTPPPLDRNIPQYANNPNNPYDPNNPNRYDPNRPYDPNNPNNRPYDPNNPNNRYDPNYNQYGNRGGQPQDGQNPFFRDPQTINREQFGVNQDPYLDGSYNDRNRGSVYTPDNSLPYDFNGNQTYYEDFRLFESTPLYGIHANLLFQDDTMDFAPIAESQQTYSAYLGDAMEIILGVRDCTVNKMTLCVTSDAEQDKCVKMRTALKAQLLKPEMDCYKGHSHIHCMQAIRSGTADVAMFDASDVYTAGVNFDLVPFISEVYNLNEPEYFVVAVAKESDPSTELTYLRGKYTCHGGINLAAGWVYPLAFLISNGWIRPYGCNSIRAAAEYFSKSCVPGALSTEYNTGVPYDNMCDLCHGASFRYCRRDASEDYFGDTGAFRCLVEGGGHVAFVKHTTVTENTGGKREEWWARDNLNDDFELLCPDGTRAEIDEYSKCNLGKVKANAMVTRGGYGYNETHIQAYTNLFLYAQTFYGRKTTDEFSFSMFSSTPPKADLIFQDATTQLKSIELSKRYYSAYLGSDFLRARRIVDCHAGSDVKSVSILTLIISSTLVFVNKNVLL